MFRNLVAPLINRLANIFLVSTEQPFLIREHLCNLISDPCYKVLPDTAGGIKEKIKLNLTRKYFDMFKRAESGQS